MAEWIYFIHPPRDNFAATMTDEEEAVWSEHFDRLKRLLAEGVVVMAGPTLGPSNTGIVVFEADDEVPDSRSTLLASARGPTAVNRDRRPGDKGSGIRR
jgi:hypothetical protein